MQFLVQGMLDGLVTFAENAGLLSKVWTREPRPSSSRIAAVMCCAHPAEKMVAELEEPYILIHEKKLSGLQAMLPSLWEDAAGHWRRRWRQRREDVMESATFRRWLSERGCSFDAGKDTVRTRGHAYVTVRLGGRSAVLSDIGSRKRLDPRVVRKIVDELGPDWNELPGPTSHV